MRAQLSALALLFGAAMSAQGAVSGFSDHDLWAAAASPTALETFDSLATGAVGSLASVGVSSMSGNDYLGNPVNQFIGNEFSLPFPMFVAGTLPSSPKFLSNDLSPPGFGSGSLTFAFDVPTTAVGAYVADQSPLGGFSIELFDGAVSLGTISVGIRRLPDSFIGIVSTASFTRATFSAQNINDSWGLDNLEVAAVPELQTVLLMGLGLALLAGLSRRRTTTSPAPSTPA